MCIPISKNHAAAEDGSFGKCMELVLIEKKHSFKKISNEVLFYFSLS